MAECLNQKDRLQARREEIIRIANRHGARDVRVFGSAARDEAGPSSDVDILVELDPGRTLLDHAALVIELENLLGCAVDVVTSRSLQPRTRERVRQEAVPL